MKTHTINQNIHYNSHLHLNPNQPLDINQQKEFFLNNIEPEIKKKYKMCMPGLYLRIDNKMIILDKEDIESFFRTFGNIKYLIVNDLDFYILFEYFFSAIFAYKALKEINTKQNIFEIKLVVEEGQKINSTTNNNNINNNTDNKTEESILKSEEESKKEYTANNSDNINTNKTNPFNGNNLFNYFNPSTNTNNTNNTNISNNHFNMNNLTIQSNDSSDIFQYKRL